MQRSHAFKGKLGIGERKYHDEKNGPLIAVVYKLPKMQKKGLKIGSEYRGSGMTSCSFFCPEDPTSFTVLHG